MSFYSKETTKYQIEVHIFVCWILFNNCLDTVTRLLNQKLKVRKRRLSTNDENSSTSSKQLKLNSVHQAILKDDDVLNSAYNRLVVSGLIEDKDFWDMQNISYEDSQSHELYVRQERGLDTNIPSLALVDVLNKASLNGGKLTLTVTPEITQAMLVEFPSVEKSFRDMVPSDMNADTFWQSFFKAQYLHYLKSRSNDYSGQSKFNQLIHDQGLQRFINMTQGSTVHTYRNILEERRESMITEHSNNSLDKETVSTNEESEPNKEAVKLQQQELIRKLNHHGSLLLDFRDTLKPIITSQPKKITRPEIIRKSFEDDLLLTKHDKTTMVPSKIPKSDTSLTQTENSQMEWKSRRAKIILPTNLSLSWEKPTKLASNKNSFGNHENLLEKYRTELFEIEQWLKHFWKNYNDGLTERVIRIGPQLENALTFLRSVVASHGVEGEGLAQAYFKSLKHSIKKFKNLNEDLQSRAHL